MAQQPISEQVTKFRVNHERCGILQRHEPLSLSQCSLGGGMPWSQQVESWNRGSGPPSFCCPCFYLFTTNDVFVNRLMWTYYKGTDFLNYPMSPRSKSRLPFLSRPFHLHCLHLLPSGSSRRLSEGKVAKGGCVLKNNVLFQTQILVPIDSL